MIKQRKGQTAMEYLMTYGWAIIIVVIVGIVLWRLGIFNPTVGKTSSGFDEFSVGTDFRLGSDGTATVSFANRDKEGRQVTITSQTVAGTTCSLVGAAAVGAGSARNITCVSMPGPGTTGTPYTGVVVAIGYTVGGITYSETGKISGKYE